MEEKNHPLALEFTADPIVGSTEIKLAGKKEFSNPALEAFFAVDSEETRNLWKDLSSNQRGAEKITAMLINEVGSPKYTVGVDLIHLKQRFKDRAAKVATYYSKKEFDHGEESVDGRRNVARAIEDIINRLN